MLKPDINTCCTSRGKSYTSLFSANEEVSSSNPVQRARIASLYDPNLNKLQKMRLINDNFLIEQINTEYEARVIKQEDIAEKLKKVKGDPGDEYVEFDKMVMKEVLKMGYFAIPIVRLRKKKYLLGTEI